MTGTVTPEDEAEAVAPASRMVPASKSAFHSNFWMPLTAMALEGMVGPEAVGAGATTLIAMSVSQAAPLGPQDLTCSVWEPVADVTCAETDWPVTKVVLELLSNE